MITAETNAAFDYAWRSDIGVVRKENQDYCGCFPANGSGFETGNDQLIIVADGMGGLNSGGEASRMAVQIVSGEYFKREAEGRPESLRRAFLEANRQIYLRSAAREEGPRMGTTCTALLLYGGKALYAHVGDSRLYRIHRDEIGQLTSDHSKVAEMVRRGILTKEEAEHHPERSHLYRALGPKEAVEIDVDNGISLGDDDAFVLCTDGLHSYVGETEIRDAVLSKSLETACEHLVQTARERGGSDNITVQIVRVRRQTRGLKRVFQRLWR